MQALDGLIDFALPTELEAHEPAEVRGAGRDDVRLLVTERVSDRLLQARFRDLPDYLQTGDLLVVNNSGTVPAELTAARADGTSFPLRLSTHLQPLLWAAEPRDVAVRADETVTLPGGGKATFLAPYNGSGRLWIVRLDLPDDVMLYIHRHGRPVRYPYVREPWPIETYQTVFATEPGSAEMPSAARPFTREIVRQFQEKGVGISHLTLHTGLASLENDEAPYPERYRVPPETADRVNRTHRAGGHVIAVGTTVVRALETVTDSEGMAHVGAGWTDLVVTPGRGVRAVDGLLTGFHEPRSTHLAMLEAFASRCRLEEAYRAAIAGRYLWHEFGDVHLIV